jgi:aspartyl-tRNA(Asn)/glutamyl-tRNA(Gln) amidotransferase subunit C
MQVSATFSAAMAGDRGLFGRLTSPCSLQRSVPRWRPASWIQISPWRGVTVLDSGHRPTLEIGRNDAELQTREFRRMRLSREEVEYVASLARLGLTDEEVSKLQDQLSGILDHIAALDRLDTRAIPPTAQVISLSNVLRPDVVVGSLSRDAVLANAPRQSEGYFEVQAVLGSAEVTEQS